ncbi:MAG: hypothetical protein Kow00127_19330 [Bacteroidales bacterium]
MMMNQILRSLAVILFLLTGALSVTAQNVEITTVESQVTPELWFTLPKLAEETSGLALEENSLLTHNDSGGEPELYRFGFDGKLQTVIRIDGAKNFDWEELAVSPDAVFIGDFGNNLGNRTDKVVYMIDKPAGNGDTIRTTVAEKIYFSFDDQRDYSKRNRNHNYDCEAMVWMNDTLRLFTKDWGDGKTRLYLLPIAHGRFPMKPADELDAGGLVTAADYHSKRKALVLLGYNEKVPFLIYIPDFNGFTFDGCKAFKATFPAMEGSQTEGIVFLNDHQVAISTEATKTYTQAVYRLDLAELFGKKAGFKTKR